MTKLMVWSAAETVLGDSPPGNEFVSSQLRRPSPYWASDGRLRREGDSRRTFAFSMGQNKGGD